MIERLKNNRQETTVAKAIWALLKGHMVCSIAADNGKKFAAYVAQTKKTPRFSLLIDTTPDRVEGWKMQLA